MLDKTLQDAIVNKGRSFLRGVDLSDPIGAAFVSDQELRLPQPPLVKAAATMPETHIRLPEPESTPLAESDLTELLRSRRSCRGYGDAPLTLQQLSYLLWAGQGITGIKGKGYATMRTVPSGGARHPFETYLLCRNVAGLEPGAYHYLPMEHALEYLGAVGAMSETISAALLEQKWAARAGAVFFWSVVPYRAEWRYGIRAHRTILMDVGHVGQDHYLAATALGLGTCAVAAFDDPLCSRLFGLDGKEEFIIYAAPVGSRRGGGAPHLPPEGLQTNGLLH